MGKWLETDGHYGTSRSAHQLQQIAEALDLPLEAFFGSSPISSEIAQSDELLRLWSALDREADRQRVLQVLRTLAAGRADA